MIKNGKENAKEGVLRRTVLRQFLIAVVVALLAANIFTLFRYVPKKYSNIELESGFNLLDPARAIYRPEDRIVNFQPLRDYLNDKYEEDPNVSIYFEYLPTGANIAVNKDAEFYPASLLKVPVVMAVAKKVERGEWRWTNKLVLMPADRDKAFGTLYREPSNSAYAIEDLVRRSFIDSDNTAHFILVRNLETSEIEDVYNHVGLKGFLETKGLLSAKRYSVVFRSLYNSSYLTEENSQKLLSYLVESGFDEYVKSGLAPGTIFAHKIGIFKQQNVYLDSGIIYLKGREYLLTVMAKDKSEPQAKGIMGDISEKVYNYVSGYRGNE